MKIVILGLSITSSWANGHATTFRSLVRELAGRGHEILFLERDVPWYEEKRDLPSLARARMERYRDLEELKDRFADEVRAADFVMVGSFVPEGIAVGEWVIRTAGGATAFYDMDTPVTLAKLEQGENSYLSRELIRQYQLYLSFTGGSILERLEQVYKAPSARALYCSVDPELYFPERLEIEWDLGYLGAQRTRHADGAATPIKSIASSEAMSLPLVSFRRRRRA